MWDIYSYKITSFSTLEVTDVIGSAKEISTENNSYYGLIFLSTFVCF